jgi:uncharacterized protein (DUF1330 family)
MTLRRVHLSAIAALGLLGAASVQAQSFTAKDIAGRWESPAPVFDETNKLFGGYVLELYANQWTLTFTASADAAGQQKLFSYRVAASTYTLGKAVSGVANAVEGDFERDSFFMTAHAQPMADMFKQANCGNGDWKLGVAQEVTAKGCAFIPSKAACPNELDIVVFDGKTLSFGDRSGNMCALPRPAKAAKASFVKKPVFAMIQAQIKDPGMFFGQYVPGHVPSVVQYGGKFGLTLKAEQALADAKLQGTMPGQMFIVQECPSLLAFNAWWTSPEYAPWSAMRSKAADVQLTLTTAVGK